MSQERPEDRGLTPQDVADRLKISRGQVYSLVHSGKLKGRRVGFGIANIRILESDLAAFLDAALIEPPESTRAVIKTCRPRRLDPAEELYGPVPDYFGDDVRF